MGLGKGGRKEGKVATTGYSSEAAAAASWEWNAQGNGQPPSFPPAAASAMVMMGKEGPLTSVHCSIPDLLGWKKAELKVENGQGSGIHAEDKKIVPEISSRQ